MSCTILNRCGRHRGCTTITGRSGEGEGEGESEGETEEKAKTTEDRDVLLDKIGAGEVTGDGRERDRLRRY